MNLIDINLFIDGYGYAGDVQTLTPPVIEELVEEFTAGGLGGTVEVPMGRMQPMEAMWTVARQSPDLTTRLFKPDISVKFRCSGVENGVTKPIVFEMRGRVTKNDEGELAPAVVNKISQRMTVKKFTKKIDGVEVFFFDVEGKILRIDGVDLWADARRALGM